MMHMQYWSAELWNRLFPIITMGNHIDVVNVYKYLKTLPSNDRIVTLLNEQCVDKFKKYGIDHNYIF